MSQANRAPAPHRDAAQWIYRGVWSWLVRWMRIPEYPPTLPARPGQLHRSFQPSPEFLSYMKFTYWLVLALLGGGLLSGWTVLVIFEPAWGIALLAPVCAVIAVPAAIAYVMLHLRYDTMWYVVTDRSMRIRRGIWSIHEVTITFENVQTVKVTQGPLQRWFGIGNVEVRTAGGGMAVAPEQGGGVGGSGHHGVIEGVNNAGEIRDLILSQLRHSKTTGLGDEVRPRDGLAPSHTSSPRLGGTTVGAAHLAILREIRDELVTRA